MQPGEFAETFPTICTVSAQPPPTLCLSHRWGKPMQNPNSPPAGKTVAKHGKRWLVLALLLPASLVLATGFLPANAAEPAVTIPWQEFQQLYAAQQKTVEQPQVTARYSIQRAAYSFTPADNQLTGSVSISGEWLAGEPEPIPLFSSELAITDIQKIDGGALVSTAAGYQLLANGQLPFSLELEVAISAANGGKYALAIPPALSNRLSIANTSNSTRDAVAYGDGLIPLGDGEFTFASRQQLQFTVAKPLPAPPLSIDMVSQFTLASSRLQQQLWLMSDATQRDVTLKFDSKLTWLRSPAGQLQKAGEITLERLPAGKPVLLRFEKPWRAEPILLPTITDNRGEQGLYTINSPLSGQLVAADSSNHTLATVPVALKTTLPGVSRLQQTRQKSLSLQFQPYTAVEQPPLIVDNVSFYSSYANDGRQLSTLRLTVPAGYGKQLSIPPVADAEVWSLAVNGHNKPLYKNSESGWVVPLSGGGDALIELTWIQQRPQLGLQGELPLNIPPLGLAARSLSVVLALPPRLELLSMESDLSPAAANAVPRSVPLHGKPRFFSRPFYRGEAITAALYYREPVERSGQSPIATSRITPPRASRYDDAVEAATEIASDIGEEVHDSNSWIIQQEAKQ